MQPMRKLTMSVLVVLSRQLSMTGRVTGWSTPPSTRGAIHNGAGTLEIKLTFCSTPHYSAGFNTMLANIASNYCKRRSQRR